MNDNLVLAVGIVISVLFLYWAWLTSPKLFTFGLVALVASIYIAFIAALYLEGKRYIMQEGHQQEKKQLERRPCTSLN